MGRRWWQRALRCTATSGRWRSYLLMLAVLVCSPVLVPLACLSLPLLCVVGLCLQLGRGRGRGRRHRHGGGASELGALREDGAEARLLQRYLEEQLQLVGAAPVFVSGGD